MERWGFVFSFTSFESDEVMMSVTPSSIVFGLRHKRLFGIINQLGEVVDALTPLQGEGVFPLECFSKVSWGPDRSAMTLHDEDATFLVDVDTDGFVFTCDLEAVPKITIEEACQIFIELGKGILAITRAGNTLNRLGIVERYALKPFKNSAAVLANDLLKLDFEGTPNTCALRLELKKTTEADLTKGERNDYRNIIMQLAAKRSEKKKESPPDLIDLSLDYQHYFVPDVSFSPKQIEAHFKYFQNESEKLRGGKLSVLYKPTEE
jgi:hypothetical protein